MNLKPMSMGEILDNCFTMYKQEFKLYLKISSLVMFGYLLSLIHLIVMGDMAKLESSFSPMNFIIILVLSIFYSILTLVTWTGTIYAASEQMAGRATDAATAWKLGFSKVGVQILASIIYFIIVIIGSILLVIPGIYLSIALTFYLTVITLENKGFASSLSRSRQLTKGSWWRVAAILFLAFTLLTIIMYIIQIILMLVLSPMLLFAPVVVQIISLTVVMIFSVMINPIMSIVFTLLYYDLRVRRESLDLQLAVDAVTETKSSGL